MVRQAYYRPRRMVLGLTQATYELDVVRSVRFSIRTGGAECEVVAFALILVGLVPWVHADDLGQIARAEVVDSYSLAVGNDVGAALPAKLLERTGNQFHLGAGHSLFLFSKCGG